MASSLGILPETQIFVNAFAEKNLAHFFREVNPFPEKTQGQRRKSFPKRVEEGDITTLAQKPAKENRIGQSTI